MADAKRDAVPDVREAVGLFHDARALEAAIGALETAGVDRAEISILAREENAASPHPHRTAEDPAAPRQGPNTDVEMQQGRTLATSMAAVVAAFAASGVIVMTGGAAVAAIAAAVAAAGGTGIIGAALGAAAGENREEFLHQQIDRGGILLWVKVRDGAQGVKIRAILERYGGSAVHEHDIDIYPAR